MHKWALYIGCQLLCTIRYNIHIVQLVSLRYFYSFLIPSRQTWSKFHLLWVQWPFSQRWPFFFFEWYIAAAVHHWVVLTWKYDSTIIVFECCCDRTFFLSATIHFILVDNPLTPNCAGVADWHGGNLGSGEWETSLSPAQVTMCVHRTGAAVRTHIVCARCQHQHGTLLQYDKQSHTDVWK